MVVSYTNSHGYIDAYANRPINNLTTNADGGGNGGGGAFFKMFEEKEAEVERDTSISSNPLDDLYPQQNNNNFYASESVIRDYIDNSLLLNTEQVACTNITQHLALKNDVQETLKFLNTQAAKTMVNSRKRNYKYQTTPKQDSGTVNRQISAMDTSITGINFFESNSSNPNVNFFMRNR